MALRAAVSTTLEMADGKSPEHIFGVRLCQMCIVMVGANSAVTTKQKNSLKFSLQQQALQKRRMKHAANHHTDLTKT